MNILEELERRSSGKGNIGPHSDVCNGVIQLCPEVNGKKQAYNNTVGAGNKLQEGLWATCIGQWEQEPVARVQPPVKSGRGQGPGPMLPLLQKFHCYGLIKTLVKGFGRHEGRG